MWLNNLLLTLVVLTTSSAASAETLTIDIPSTVLKTFKDTNNVTAVTHSINGVLQSLNLNDNEVNVILMRLKDSHENIDLIEFESSLRYLFHTTITTNWQLKHALQEIAKAANNIRVYEILYEILWQELKYDHNKTNPFIYIELYTDLESILVNVTSDKLQRLHNNIQTDLVNYSAQILQSYFIQKPTIWQLLKHLKNLNNLYHATIPRVFENLNSIEDPWQIAKELLEFDSYTQEAVFNHITYIKYLQSRYEAIPDRLYSNLELLIARPDFVNTSIIHRQLASKILPASLGSLFAGQKICIRNATTNFYLYECPETYLMCSNIIEDTINPINRKKATFDIERIGNNQYTLHSSYWTRYLHLQISTSNSKNISSTITNGMNNTKTALNITKNLYSSAEVSSWFIRFQSDYATIQDSTEQFYICGGNPAYWSDVEKYAYTRQSMSSYEIKQECLWLLEDCSDVTSIN